MAKRQSPAEPQATSDPFDSDIEDLNLDDLNIDDLRVDDIPDTEIDAGESDGGSGATAALTAGQIVGGGVQVILSAILIFVLLAALAAGGVLAAQRLGVIPQRGADATGTAVSALPTTAAAEAATLAPSATPRPTVVADSGCPAAADWWNSQQVQSTYKYFTQQVIDVAKTSNNVAALTEQMRIRRDFVANFAADSCLTGAKNALLAAFDATIAVARSTNSGDQTALAQQQPAETKAYADLDDALREVGIDVQATTPSP